MDLELLLQLSLNMSFVALAAYLMGRNRYIIQCATQPYRLKHWLILSVAFSILSAIGTYTGIPVHDALANTRMVGVIMSGFMGGPLVGLATGAASAIHRYSIGGFTAEICAVASLVVGLMAGLVRRKVGFARLDWKTGAAVALAGEFIQKSLVMLLAQPYEKALAMEKAIALPTTIVSVVGTIIFIVILKNIREEQSLYGAKAAEQALDIATQALPYARQGLNEDSAGMIAGIIHDITNMDAVAVTDREKIIAFIGAGADHHTAGQAIVGQATREALQNGQVVVHKNEGIRECPQLSCPLRSSVIAPLMAHGKAIGTIKLFRSHEDGISPFDIRIASGVAHLLSVQLELAEMDQQVLMREKAELKALQAQINPHFLFNTLSIIMSFCRTDPDTARQLLSHLSTLLKRSFQQRQDVVTLGDELEGIHAYLEIAKRRFGSRLRVQIHAAEEVKQVLVPVLSVQPLVENAVQHGLFPKTDACELEILAFYEKEQVIIRVCDNGIGMQEETLQKLKDFRSDGIGLKNVNGRLVSLFGEEAGLQVQSQEGQGTQVELRIPWKGTVQHAV